MSRGPQPLVDLPDPWWGRLEDDYRRLGFDDLAQFCAAPQSISVKTLRRAKAAGKIKEASLKTLKTKLHYRTINDLLKAWGNAADAPVALIDPSAHARFEEQYGALSRSGLYDAAAVVAHRQRGIGAERHAVLRAVAQLVFVPGVLRHAARRESRRST